jgi:hypothetical protein
MRVILYCLGLASLLGLIVLACANEPVGTLDIGDGPPQVVISDTKGVVAASADESGSVDVETAPLRAPVVTPVSMATTAVRDLSPVAAKCIQQINRVLRDNNKAPIDGASRIGDSDLTTLLESWAGLYANYESAKTTYRDSMSARLAELRQKLEADLAAGAPITFDETASFAPRQPGERVSILQPANTNRSFALRVQRSELQPHADAVDAALRGLVYFGDESARKLFSN